MSGCFVSPVPANCSFFKPVEMMDDSPKPVYRRCFFYEDKGRDIGFPRWRVCFYYESHMAITRFFASESLKDCFLATLERKETTQ